MTKNYNTKRSLAFLLGMVIGFGVVYAGSKPEKIAGKRDGSSAGEAETVLVGENQAFAGLIDEISRKRVIYIGEIHNRYDHHLNQLAVIKALYERGENFAVGLEFFQRPYQRHLDDYVAGVIDEKPLLKRTAYYANWGYDFRLYRPILEYARENGIALVALNAPRGLVRQVSEKGFDGVSGAWKNQLPEIQIPADHGYRHRLERIFDAHRTPGKRFDKFVQVQLLWDEYMADTAVDYLQSHHGRKLVVLAGSGHVAVGSGIPQRVHSRVSDAYTVLVSSGAVFRGLENVDYVMTANGDMLPEAGKLGLSIREENGGVTVDRRWSNRSVAASGILPGDRITSIAGEPVRSVEDVRLALLDRSPGEQVWVEVNRTWNGDNPERLNAIIELI